MLYIRVVVRPKTRQFRFKTLKPLCVLKKVGRRIVKTRTNKYFGGFNPAVSKEATESFQGKIKTLRKLTILSMEKLPEQVNLVIREWTNYFNKFTASIVHKVLSRVDLSLTSGLSS